MALTLTQMIDEVQLFVGATHENPQFSRPVVTAEVNNALAWAVARGLSGSYIFSGAVTLTAGDERYNLQSVVEKDHSDRAGLTTAATDIVWIRRNSDGQMLERRSPKTIEALLTNPTPPTGKPTDYALFTVQQAVTGYTAAKGLWLMVYPSPAASDLPDALDVMVRLRHALNLVESRDTSTSIAYDDAMLRAMVLKVAAALVSRVTDETILALGLNRAVARDWMAEAEAIVAHEVGRQYRMQLPDDIQLVEN